MIKKIRDSYFLRLLFSFAAFGLLVLVVFGVVVYVTFGRINRTNLRTQSIETVSGIRQAIEDSLDSYFAACEVLAQDVSVQAYLNGDDSEAVSLDILRVMYGLKNSFSQQASITLTRINTPGVLTTGEENPRLLEKSYLNWGAFRKANSAEGAVIHTTARDSSLAETTRIATVLAVRDTDGKIRGYVLIEMPRTSLEAIANEYAALYNTPLLMVNDNDTVIYHSAGQDAEGLGKLGDYGTIEPVWQGEAAGTLWDGEYAYSRCDGIGLTVLIGIPAGVASQFSKVLMLAAALAMAISVLTSFGFSWVIAQSVSQPVQKLKTSMDKVRSGDFTAKVEVSSNDEIGQLGETFNDMTGRISELVQHVKDKQESLRIAESKALSLQVNPHFIYNTLELIRWSARLNKTDVVVNVAVNFGKLMRRILNNKDEFSTVEYELDMVHSYIEIQKNRYADRLQVETDVEDAILPDRLPKLLLQPLIENAIVHGLEDKPGVGLIRLTGRGEGDYLVFTISDNGVGMSEETLAQVRQMKENGMFNIGLNNVSQRAGIYGDDHCGLEISSVLGEGTSVKLTVKRLPPEQESPPFQNVPELPDTRQANEIPQQEMQDMPSDEQPPPAKG